MERRISMNNFLIVANTVPDDTDRAGPPLPAHSGLGATVAA